MAEKEWYRDWFSSPYYHKLYFERDEKEAESFIHKLVGHLKINTGSHVLDVGCGRGRHCRLLSSLGLQVTGIDISSENIEYAKQTVGETDKLQFFIHDIRLPFWGNYFDHAFNFFTSFGYFHTRREHEAAIRTIGNSIKPGGYFVIDYLNVHHTEEHLLPGVTKKIDVTTYDLRRWDDESHFYKTINVSDQSLPQPIEFTEKVAKFSLGDFTDMLSYQGMQVQEVFGDYNLGSYDIRTTPRMIIIARKVDSQSGDKEKRLYSDGRRGDALT
ncbi:MAG: class I SAM-dependent methyltransferase [Chitinophagaceae bacterium]|nr:class I SAM-dependent methyltransferase [Chitinophagaceae bacterium]